MGKIITSFMFFVRALLSQWPHAQLVLVSKREARIVEANGSLILLLDAENLDEVEVKNWISESVRYFTDRSLDFIIFSDTFSGQEFVSSLQRSSNWRKAVRLMIVDASLNFTFADAKWWLRKYTRAFNRAKADILANESSMEAGKEISERFQSDQLKIASLVHFQESFGSRSYMATIAFAVAMVLVFGLEEWWGGSTYFPTLFAMGANVKGSLEQPWRLLTSIFLHSGYAHIIFNVYVLIILGKFFNQLVGNAKFIALFLFSGLCGSVSSSLLGVGSISVGASGGLWGLFGASAALIIRPSSLLPELLRERIKRITVINLVLNLSISFLPMVDLWAHLGGGVGGFLIGLIFVKSAQSQDEKQVSSSAVGWIALSVIALMGVFCSFGYEFYKQRPWKFVQKMTLSSRQLGNTGLTMLLPDFLRELPFSSTSHKQEFRFGEVPFDPVMISVVFIRTQETLNLEQKTKVLGQFGEQSLDGWQKDLQEQVIVDDNPTKTISYSSPDRGEFYQILQVRADAVVKTEIYILPHTPSVIRAGFSDLAHLVRR